MKKIFVNLKRFEVSKSLGGICPIEDPLAWIDQVMIETMELGLGKLDDIFLTYFLPEALIPGAIKRLNDYDDAEKINLGIGCQSVFREDIRPGGNFGAFTSNRPASAMKLLNCSWALIAHSEERRDKYQMLVEYDPQINQNEAASQNAFEAVDRLVGSQLKRALESGLKVVYCVGESAEQKGSDDFEVYSPRVREVLKNQLVNGLKDLEPEKANDIVIGYEPIWAIGPGKTPPDSDYISFVSEYIKTITGELFGVPLDVIYGGGLKEENAASIAAINSIDGGLVALTKFVQPIGFDPLSLLNIVKAYTL